jgi:hypothetical protein
MKRLFLLMIAAGSFLKGISDEGMWIPLLLDSLNYKDMQEKGLRLSPEEIYSINQASLKDAVVIFGNGCTGELISPEGLMITNHHCGYSRILSHSTLEKNYLADGFWAGSKSEELANPGLSVSFLVRIENVTAEVLGGISDDLQESERMQRVSNNIQRLSDEAVQHSHYRAEVRPFYFGKEYYLFVYEVFRDVRLVGAPPEAVGNFGGDTDNWIWPRHTGDFSLFRIYAGKDNEPADYSPDNVPYQPKKYLNISVDGIQEGDFTMVLGYPGRTDQYLISDAVSLIAGKSFPAKIGMRTARLEAIQEEINRGPEYKLRYASKYKDISNSWKKWMGVTKGVDRAKVVENKKLQEEEFTRWASRLEPDSAGYSSLMKDFDNIFSAYSPLYLVSDLGGELLNSIELTSLVDKVQIKFFGMLDSSETYKKSVIADLKRTGRNVFKSSAVAIDHRVLPELLKIYDDFTDPEFHPAFYQEIKNKYRGDYQAYVSDIYSRSMFTDSVRYFQAIGKSEKSIRNNIMSDPLMSIYRDFSILLMTGLYDRLDSLNNEMRGLYRKYVSGLMDMHPDITFYPDANFTMRVTYGKAEGYKPTDAVKYNYFSTLDGVIEKEDPEIADYKVPPALKALYEKSDFGTFLEKGKVPVCFIASNHTSGGNSGSPVLDANGNLIGINFDRNWEGTVSDYEFDPAVCRNISLDIRYVLFIIDKLADADWILDELTIIDN